MNEEELLGKAIRIAAVAHEGQYDKGGEPYIVHCLSVMRRVGPNKKLMIVGVLHDVVEDTAVTWRDLEQVFPPDVIAAIDALTKERGESYNDYIKRVATHPMARQVKIADLTHNMDTSRIPQYDIEEKDYRRWDKYRRALVRLKREV